ncbi:MAG: hypothetical protein ACKO0V_18380, partial [bacterium]
MRLPWVALAILVFYGCSATCQTEAHDIPRQRVDRTVQMVVEPRLLRVEYTLELDDSTIATDFRRLEPGALPPDPEEWLNAYGKRVADLLPQAFRLVGPNQEAAEGWKTTRVEKLREIHTVYEFTYEIPLNSTGLWRFSDQNFRASEGASRLGIRASGGAQIKSPEAYPESARSVPYQPFWMLDDKALKRSTAWQGEMIWPEGEKTPPLLPPAVPAQVPDDSRQFSRFTLMGAFLLGLWHTLQPGHGKSWLVASSMVRRANLRGLSKLLVGWVFSHFLVLLLLAGAALFLPSAIVSQFSAGLRQLAALLIACPAAGRLGALVREKLPGAASSEMKTGPDLADTSPASLLRTGIVAGMVPCWEAVGLLLLGLSAGYPMQAFALLLFFMAGSLLVIIFLVIFAEFVMRHFTVRGFMGYGFIIA